METPHKNRKLHRITNGVEEKECNTCMRWKSLDSFSKASAWDKLDRKCKDCAKKYREKNRDKLLVKKKEYRVAHVNERKAWLEANKESQREYNKVYQAKYRAENAEELKANAAKRFQENKESIYDRLRKKRAENPQLRATHNLRSRLSIALRGIAKSAHTMELLGCSHDFFRDHMEFQFDDKMTWENYGEWHVDHIIPCAVFNLTDPVEQRICFHYSNLQPLWGAENIAKSDKVNPEDLENAKARLTPEIIDRLVKLREAEVAKQNARDIELLDTACNNFSLFWSCVETPKKVPLPRADNDDLIRENISASLLKFYQTADGKNNKTKALAKRSQTMAASREEIRRNTTEKKCGRCQIIKQPQQFGKKNDAKDGLQPYCKDCIYAVKKAKRAVVDRAIAATYV